jgi:peptidoglycan/LPS O-acetylase OafA/YrhL
MDCLLSSRHIFRYPFFFYFGHFWSLAAEEQFYLVWPLVVFLAKDRVWLRNICLAVCILTPLARLACFHLIPQVYIDSGILLITTPFRADGFLLGGLFALMLRGPEARWLSKLVRPALLFLTAALFVSESVYRIHMHHFINGAYTPALSSIGYSVINLFCALLILLSLEPASLCHRLFALRPFRQLGQMSYGFYVFHDIPHPAYMLLIAHTTAAGGRAFVYQVALVGFIFTLALSYLSYRFYETKFLRLKGRFTL